MTMNKLLDIQARITKITKPVKPTSTIIEWCEVLTGSKILPLDEWYPSDGYDYEVEFGIVSKELGKFPNIPNKYPVGCGKRNYLTSIRQDGIVLLNSGSRDFQILVKFTEEYQSLRVERLIAEEERLAKKNKRTENRLNNYTGKILYSYNRTEQGANSYESQEENLLYTLKKGKIVDVDEVYSRSFSRDSDIYIIADWGEPSVDVNEKGEKENIAHAAEQSDNYIDIKNGYFSTDLGYWEVVQRWWDSLEFPTRGLNKFKI